eukprot:TRINITY_DN5205_c0_g1_i3.p1 TRINITY_DN5205_c0_g1~~TRINITY_DN5205_c0_g1_i3.p1  ORF type:complete len:470 (-),score=118.69 TRINITY_DN5205_c0_g1_i3:37-1446(-)
MLKRSTEIAFIINKTMDSVYNYFSSHPTYTSSPIWMLGTRFDNEAPAPAPAPPPSSTYGFTFLGGSSEVVPPPSFPRFVEAFKQKLWFSYRRDFPSIDTTSYDNDVGWGCTLRSGQMLLAQALVLQYLGKDFIIDGTSSTTPSQLSSSSSTVTPPPPLPPSLIYQIVRWFADQPSPDVPYSIHRIACAGRHLGKSVGEWFGPSTIAHALGDLVNEHSPGNMTVYVAEDSAVYIDRLRTLCTTQRPISHRRKSSTTPSPPPPTSLSNHTSTPSSTSPPWNPILITIPLRLGLDSINEVYIPALTGVFQIPQCIGIVGGRPRASLYFVASQDDGLFYLDPHSPQPTIISSSSSDPTSPFDLSTYHNCTPRKICASEIDPSLAVAFYCRNQADLDDFLARAKTLTQGTDTPLFAVVNKAPDYLYKDADLLREVDDDNEDDKNDDDGGDDNSGDEFDIDDDGSEIGMDDLVVL